MKLKASHQAAGGKLLVDLAGLAPPALHSVIARSLFAKRLFNVTVTNVPGSPTTLYASGSPLRRVIPLVPLAAEHAVAVAALSYDGTVFFCVHADRDAAPDAHRVVEGIQAELDAWAWSPREPQRRRRARPPGARPAQVRTRHLPIWVRHTDARCGRADSTRA